MPFRSATSLMVQKGVDKRKEVELLKGEIVAIKAEGACRRGRSNKNQKMVVIVWGQFSFYC
jgi:hypothetical protein